MSLENDAVIRRYFEADEAGFPDPEGVFAPGFVSHSSSSDATVDRDQFLAWAKRFNDALPYRCTLDDLLVDGDRVAVRVTWRGRHTGKFGDLEPTGHSFRVSGVGIFRIADGLIAERWLEFDEIGLMRQLGAL